MTLVLNRNSSFVCLEILIKGSQIKTKKDIKDLIIGEGRKKEKFRPDYLIFLSIL